MKKHIKTKSGSLIIVNDHGGYVNFDSSQQGLTKKEALEFADLIIDIADTLPEPLPQLTVGKIYFMVKKDQGKWALGLFRRIIGNRYEFSKAMVKDDFSVDPKKWVFNEVQTERVEK